MKQHPCITQRRVLRTALFAAALAILVIQQRRTGGQCNPKRRAEEHAPRRAYRPARAAGPTSRMSFSTRMEDLLRSRARTTIFRYPGLALPFLPNPLNGNADEPNGTMIIDVTDPTNPKETAHIPVPVTGGQAQMARMCLGSDLPDEDLRGKVYLMRNIQGSSAGSGMKSGT